MSRPVLGGASTPSAPSRSGWVRRPVETPTFFVPVPKAAPRTSKITAEVVVPVLADWKRGGRGGDAAQEGKKQTAAGKKRPAKEPQGPTKEGRAAKKARRAAWRAANILPEGEDLADHSRSKTVLEKRTVSLTIRERYDKIMVEVREWVSEVGLSVESHPGRDRVAALFLEREYFAGEGLQRGNYIMAAMKDCYPQYKKAGGERLVRGEEALKGWRKLDPPQTRLPLPRAVMALVAAGMMRLGQVRAARSWWLGMTAYLRPGELLGMKHWQLSAPVRGSKEASVWVVLLHPASEGKGSKTGAFDEAVRLDSAPEEELNDVWRLLRTGKDGDPLLDCTYRSFFDLVVKAAEAEGVGMLNVVPYSMRHAGPSADRSLRLRAVAEVKKRGRWVSDSSMARYEKAGRVGAQLMRLPAAVRAKALAADSRIGDILRGSWLP